MNNVTGVEAADTIGTSSTSPMVHTKPTDYAERLFKIKQLEHKRDFAILVRDGMLKHLHELYDKMANYEHHATKKNIVWARGRYNEAESDRITAHMAIRKLLDMI